MWDLEGLRRRRGGHLEESLTLLKISLLIPYDFLVVRKEGAGRSNVPHCPYQRNTEQTLAGTHSTAMFPRVSSRASRDTQVITALTMVTLVYKGVLSARDSGEQLL